MFATNDHLDAEGYIAINKHQTSEMFTGLMRVLHETLPCSKNFFKMKQKYQQEEEKKTEDEETKDERWSRRSIKKIATPKIVRGLSLSKSPARMSGGSQLSRSSVRDDESINLRANSSSSSSSKDSDSNNSIRIDN